MTAPVVSLPHPVAERSRRYEIDPHSFLALLSDLFALQHSHAAACQHVLLAVRALDELPAAALHLDELHNQLLAHGTLLQSLTARIVAAGENTLTASTERH